LWYKIFKKEKSTNYSSYNNNNINTQSAREVKTNTSEEAFSMNKEIIKDTAKVDLRKFENSINSIDYIKSIIQQQQRENANINTTNLDSSCNGGNDAFYIVDLEDICNKHINWITRLPRVEPHYAIKCNTDQMLLKLLAFLGAGFDCASKNEIQTVLDLGVSPSRIIFANPCKQASMIRYANARGVQYMTFDNELELYKIKEHHPDAKCVLRIITNDADALCRFSMKFGADMETSMKLVETAVKLNLDLVGVSFHVGSGQMSPSAFAESISNARQLFDYAREQFGIRMHLLDLGGGYPGSHDSEPLFNAISMEINRALDQHFPYEYFAQLNGLGDNKLKIIAEPGRYYACSAFTLCVSVIAKRVMTQSEQQQQHDREAILKQINPPTSFIDHSKSNMYYINDGVYASFNCLFYDHAECFPILINDDRSPSATLYKSSVWGPTCDGLDVINKECLLPDLHVGESLVFRNMGAYTISGAVAFNGIPLARCIYTVSTSWDTIKYAFIADDMNELSLLDQSANTSSCASSYIRISSIKNDECNSAENVCCSADVADEAVIETTANGVDCAITV